MKKIPLKQLKPPRNIVRSAYLKNTGNGQFKTIHRKGLIPKRNRKALTKHFCLAHRNYI